MQSGIYGLVCVPTGKVLVGSAINWASRTKTHIRHLRRGDHQNGPTQAAWIKYGEPNFEVKLLEAVEDHAQLGECERWWVKHFGPKAFNIQPGGSAGYYIHGMTGSSTWKSWDSMLQRCTNPNSPDYPKWGGIGVKVCKRWQESFANFLADMGERPPGKSIDRHPDPNGHYAPGNCRWATKSEQQRNKRNTRRLTYKGVTKLLIEWAIEKQIPYDLLLKRVNAGATEDQLFAPSYWRYAGIMAVNGTKPKRYRRTSTRKILKFTAFGKTLSIVEWAKETGMTKNCLYIRLQRYKMDPEAALQPYVFRRGPGFKCTSQKLKGDQK